MWVETFPILGGRLLKTLGVETCDAYDLVSNPWREAIEV